MPRLCYFRRMNDILPESPRRPRSGRGIVALGYKVIRHSCASDLWQVEGYILTETELVGFAVVQGVQAVSDQVQ